MSPRRRAAAGRLADVLRRENDLLKAQNYAGVKSLFSDKLGAVHALEDSAAEPTEADTPEDIALARRLAELAEQNRQALRQALSVQDKIMGIVADAARRSMDTAQYGGGGVRRRQPARPAMAMIVQA